MNKYLSTLLTVIFNTHFAFAADQLPELLEKGELVAARKVVASELANSNKASRWNTLMRAAWLEDVVSEHRKAIEYSNQALEVAAQENDNFKTGRSLCWLGWAYSRLGLYDLALQFLDNAVELSSKKGQIEIPMVWGLATQEIGAIYFKQGDTNGALNKLQSTYKLASELGVDTGIAEGGTYLAEIYLEQGNFGKAESFATAALEKIDSAGPDIHGKAYIIASKIWLNKAKLDSIFHIQANKHIKSALDFCKRRKLPICQAEALILKSQTIPENNFNERHVLVAEAFEILANKESELRGLAEAELGRVYLENNDTKLAEFYIKNGIQVNKELFRKVDRAFLNKQLANLAEKNADSETQKKELVKTVDAALQSNLLPQALEAQIKLSEIHEKQGFYTASLQWSSDAQKTLQKIITENPTQQENPTYQNRLVTLEERSVVLSIHIKRDNSQL